jgi:hypothetical protein
MYIMPAWITSQSESGVVCVLGSQPARDAKEVTILNKDIMSVSISDSPADVGGRRFGVIVLKKDEVPK